MAHRCMMDAVENSTSRKSHMGQRNSGSGQPESGGGVAMGTQENEEDGEEENATCSFSRILSLCFPPTSRSSCQLTATANTVWTAERLRRTAPGSGGSTVIDAQRD